MLGTLPVEVYKSEFRHVEDVGFFLTAFSNSMTARATPPQDLCDASVLGVDKPGGKGVRVLWLLERLLGNTRQVRTRLRERRTFDTSLWLHSETKQHPHVWDPCSGVEDDTDEVRISIETPRHGESFYRLNHDRLGEWLQQDALGEIATGDTAVPEYSVECTTTQLRNGAKPRTRRGGCCTSGKARRSTCPAWLALTAWRRLKCWRKLR